MVTKQVRVAGKSGLHARPASVFVQEAKKYEADITVRRLDGPAPAVNAKSIMRLLTAEIGQGAWVEIAADGSDAQAAVEGLAALVEAGCGE